MKSIVIALTLLVGFAACKPTSIKTISVNNGGEWGEWYVAGICPQNSIAVGFDIKVEPDQGISDDTAMNGIQLHCFDNTTYKESTVESKNAEWGQWSGRMSCLLGGYLTAFRLNVQPHHDDDTAANNIQFKCNTGEVLTGNGLNFGIWGELWSDECTTGICGVETKIEKYQVGGDDTALNDVRFLCC